MAGSSRTTVKKDPYVKGFKRVTDLLDVRRLLEQAIDTQAKVDVKLVQSERQFTAKLMESSDPTQCLEIAAPSALSDPLLQQETGGEVMLIAFLRGQTLLCIQASGAIWDKRVLKIPAPWSVLKLQRRKEARLEIPTAYEMDVTIDAVDGGRRRIDKRIIDISASGLAFQVTSSTEASYFKQGLFLRRIMFKLEHREIFLDARVCNCIPLGGHLRYSGFKIGVEFIRVTTVDSDSIAAFVARHLAQVYT